MLCFLVLNTSLAGPAGNNCSWLLGFSIWGWHLVLHRQPDCSWLRHILLPRYYFFLLNVSRVFLHFCFLGATLSNTTMLASITRLSIYSAISIKHHMAPWSIWNHSRPKHSHQVLYVLITVLSAWSRTLWWCCTELINFFVIIRKFWLSGTLELSGWGTVIEQ